MDLGAFCVSLTVADLHKSKSFYETLGFSEVGGNIDQNWLVLANGNIKIGLFQGMFEKNILTFNPGWDQRGHDTETFEDVRDLQATLQAAGVEPVRAADPDGSGPDYFTLIDPDGNPILIDQHRPKP
jgi:catechol 2,3-dioxygenase-like lactoylglutathione lyase family enzyme